MVLGRRSDGRHIDCKYHGWQFEPCSGQCTAIPSLCSNSRLDCSRIFATAFPCEERDGRAWVFVPSPGAGKIGESAAELRLKTELVRSGDKWFSSLTTVTPITASTCRIDVVAAWNVFYRLPFVPPLARFFGGRFVYQDQLTMIQQARGLRHNPSLMLIDDADKPAKWYFALKQARLEGSAGAQKHPLDGPVELHWRS